MRAIAAALGSAVAVAAFLSLFFLVNGGYVYRVECPRAGGTTEIEWTYRWSSFIPYIGYERTGCKSHTATRIALDAVGIWKTSDDESSAERQDYSPLYPTAVVNRAIQGCVATGQSRSFCQCAINEFTTRIRPDQWNLYAGAIQGGATRYDDLPESIRDDVRDAVTATERDCR